MGRSIDADIVIGHGNRDLIPVIGEETAFWHMTGETSAVWINGTRRMCIVCDRRTM